MKKGDVIAALVISIENTYDVLEYEQYNYRYASRVQLSYNVREDGRELGVILAHDESKVCPEVEGSLLVLEFMGIDRDGDYVFREKPDGSGLEVGIEDSPVVDLKA